MSDRKVISNTLTVNIVEDGESAPYYFQEWYAWSNVESTVNTTTSPFGNNTEPNPAWSTSIPENTGWLAYLWRKSIRYVWNENTRDYSAETAQYFRMSGTNGTSVRIKDNIDYAFQNGYNSAPDDYFPLGATVISNTAIDNYPKNQLYRKQYVYSGVIVWNAYATANDGDAFTINHGNLDGSYQSQDVLAGHLVSWSEEADKWIDLGVFRGQNGITYYTHVVWAKNVVIENGVVTAVENYSAVKPVGDNSYIWMGTKVDRTYADPTSSEVDRIKSFDWSITKGDGGAVAYVNPEKISVQCDKNGKVVASTSHPLTFSMTVGGEAISVESVSISSNLPTGVGYRATVGAFVLFVNTEATADGIAEGVTFEVTGFYEDKEFVAYVTVALIGVCQGEDGLSPNVNILLRTIFDDGIDKVREKWSFDSSYVSIDTASDTVVEGRKSIRLNSQNNVNGVSISQSVLGKIKPNTWYTVSFNAFHIDGGRFAMSFYNLIGGSRHLIYDGNVIVDGVARTIESDSCDVIINGAWDGARHTVTFKTRSSEHISTTKLDFVFFQGYSSIHEPPHSQTAICMPKLEIGEVATAYMANEDDLRGEKGDDGARGKIGRFFYFAGTFNSQDNDPTHVFVVNDAQAPYFEHSETVTTQSGTTTIKRYHLFNYETNGSYTMSEMWAISSNWNNKPWEAMTNDFKYIITEALFAGFAKLGSFVVNYDFFLSQYGTLIYNNNGTIQTTTIDSTNYNTIIGGGVPYTHFKADDPDCSTNPTSGNYKFRPTLCFNAMTGETYQQNAHVKGEIRATSGTIGGFIISPTQISSDNNNIVLNSNGTATITGTINATNGSITGQMNIGTGGSIIVGSDNSGKYRIKISQNSSNGQISMIDSSGNSMVLINYNTNKNAGQVKVSEADATHPRYTFINPNAIESMYNYKNANNQWNGDSSHITTQLGYRMAETEYEDNYVSGGSGSTKHVKIGVTSGVVSLRAYDESGASAWPTASVPMNNYPSMTKGLVHVISLGSLKEILDNQAWYSLSYGKLSVMLVQTS